MHATRLFIAAAISVAFAAPVLASTIAPGFDTSSLGRTDDSYTSAIDLGFSANFFGNTYTSVYVSNNGYLTFGRGQGDFRPVGLGAGYRGNPIIAPFYDDVDTRNAASGVVTYGTGTYDGHAAFGATWGGVGYYSSKADKLDTFQVILTDRSDLGTGDFDIFFNYGAIQWDATQDTSSAAVGFNAGNGAANSYFSAPGSLMTGAFLDGGPNALSGTQFEFASRSGAPVAQVPVQQAQLDATASVPEPKTFLLLGLGIAAAVVVRRRKAIFGVAGSMSSMAMAMA